MNLFGWFFFAILAQFVYTIVVYLDKYIISKQIRDYTCMPVYSAIVGIVVGMFIWSMTGFPILPGKDTLIVLGTGILTIWGTYFYFKAISSSSPSQVIFLMQMIPVLVLLLAYVFLHEHITLKQVSGFLFVFMACLAVSLEKIRNFVRISSSFFLILLVDLFWSIAAVLMKFATETNSFSKILSYESFGVGIGGILLYFLFSSVRHSFYSNIRIVRKLVLGILFINEGTFVLAEGLKFFAYSLGPAALVSIVGSIQVFWGILFGFVLTLFAPRIFKEEFNRKLIVKKIGWAFILIIGIALIY